MAIAKRPPPPVILVANDLVEGHVVFRTAQGWSLHHRDALIAANDEAAEALEAEGRAEMAANNVVDAYLIDVELGDDGPTPRHFRERFKTFGPSVRPDLRKQAARGRNVSL